MQAVVRLFVFLQVIACLTAVAASADRSAQAPSRGQVVCTVHGQALMSFGAYDTMSNLPLDAQGRVSYSCEQKGGGPDDLASGPLHVRIMLGTGMNNSYNRGMLGTGYETLHYNLYIDPQRREVWGDCLLNTSCYFERARPNGREVVIPVYGRIQGGQDITAGAYADQVIVTLDF